MIIMAFEMADLAYHFAIVPATEHQLVFSVLQAFVLNSLWHLDLLFSRSKLRRNLGSDIDIYELEDQVVWWVVIHGIRGLFLNLVGND